LPGGGRAGILLQEGFENRMKITDDYNAKYRLWAANPRLIPAPAPLKLPHFGSRRFTSHAEMNEWKQAVLLTFAQAAPGR
jgi:hypothetical protein